MERVGPARGLHVRICWSGHAGHNLSLWEGLDETLLQRKAFFLG